MGLMDKCQMPHKKLLLTCQPNTFVTWWPSCLTLSAGGSMSFSKARHLPYPTSRNHPIFLFGGNPRIASLGHILFLYPPTRKNKKSSTYGQDQYSISNRMPSVAKAKEDWWHESAAIECRPDKKNRQYSFRAKGPFYCESDSFVGLGLAAYPLFSRSKWTKEVKCHAFNWN